MENNQPTNKIDSITQFLTLHNTTIIAVIMAISAMIGQNYQQNEEEVFEIQENFEDKQADLESIELMYGTNSSQYMNAAKEYQKEEEALLEEAMDAIDFDSSELENIPKAEGRLMDYTDQNEGEVPQPQGAQEQPENNVQQTPGNEQQPTETNMQQPMGAAQQPAGNAKQPAEKQMENQFEGIAKTAETRSRYSDYATTILQISVLLSSIGVSAMNRFLSYLASGLTLVGVVVEIIAATM